MSRISTRLEHVRLNPRKQPELIRSPSGAEDEKTLDCYSTNLESQNLYHTWARHYGLFPRDFLGRSKLYLSTTVASAVPIPNANRPRERVN